MARKKAVKESKAVIADRRRRMKWWKEARFGMFVHFGLYSQLGRHEWVMNRERIPVKEYERLAPTFNPKPGCPREWARLAKTAGMKYMVMTTKHHEGFCLWDTKQTTWNSVRRGPHRDIVREYVDACREYGLRIGFYYSLMDWHHPDGARCYKNTAARRRFLDFTQGCVRELMSNYGKIDTLWYDVSWPLPSPTAWESAKMNAMARKLQGDLIINNRSQLPEDFGTPEGHIAAQDTEWEACMTFNGAWGWRPTPAADWLTARSVIVMLNQVSAGGGNLLLNIGPRPDGSVPPEAVTRLGDVGKWTKKYGEALYGKVDRIDGMESWAGAGSWSRKGRTCYFWVHHWPGEVLTIGGLRTKVKAASLMPEGKKLRFKQEKHRLIIRGLPAKCPDRVCSVGMVKIEFAGKPRQQLAAGCADIGV